MNISNRQQLLGIVAIIAVGLLVGDRLILSPLTKSWKARSDRIAELKRSVTQGAATLKREQVIRDRWGNMRTNTLSGPASVAESQMLKAFKRWSDESGISVSGIRPESNQSEDEYMTLDCRADASGSLPALSRFLFLVERDPLAVKVDSVELTARDNNGQQLTLALQVSGLLLQLPAK